MANPTDTQWNTSIFSVTPGGDVEIDFAAVNIRDFNRKYSEGDFTRPDIRLDEAETLPDDWRYDLQNSGWSDLDIDNFKAEFGEYPSFADPSSIIEYTGTSIEKGPFEQTRTNRTYAPIGNKILREQDRRSLNTEEDSTDAFFLGPLLATAHFSGRLFSAYDSYYKKNLGTDSGLKDTTDHSPARLYFSQLAPNEVRQPSGGLEINPKVIPCMGDNDPTAAVNNVPLNTDGGYVDINSSGHILQLLPSRTGLVVATDEGIYAVTGTDLNGFDPLNFRVDKISEANAVSHYGGVTAQDTVFLWTTEGILLISPNENSGFLTARNISRGKVDSILQRVNDYIANDFNTASWYDANKSSKDVYCVFDSSRKSVNWLFRSGTSERFYNEELCIDLETGAFTTNSYPFQESDFNNFGVIGVVDTGRTYETGKYFKQDVANITSNRTKTSLIYVIFVEQDGKNFVNFCSGGGQIEFGTNPFADDFAVPPISPQTPTVDSSGNDGMSGTAVGYSAVDVTYTPEGDTEENTIEVAVKIGKWSTSAVPDTGEPITVVGKGTDTDLAVFEQEIPEFESGEYTLEAPSNQKDGLFIDTYMYRTEDGFETVDDVEVDEDGNTSIVQDTIPTKESSFTVGAYWDWSDSQTSGKISTEQEAYKLLREYMPEDPETDDFDYGQYVVKTRIKVRGRGRAIKLVGRGSTDDDCILLGLGMTTKVTEN